MGLFTNRKNRLSGWWVFLLFPGTLLSQSTDAFSKRLSEAAIALTRQTVQYDPSYFSIPYPNGDVPPDRGVCTDVIIRAYRKLNIDLQKEVHEDMQKNFSSYPDYWGLKTTDKNIDHRRVPNLMTYFSRHGLEKPKSKNPDDYGAGDIVAWDLGGGITHIGILIDKKTQDNQRFLVVHNIGRGQEISDCLFEFKIIGHYSYLRQD